jgi:hypothetical protein
MCRFWTQRIRFLVNSITYLEPPYVLDYNYIIIPLPTGFFVNAYLNSEGVQEFLTRILTLNTKTRDVSEFHQCWISTCDKSDLVSLSTPYYS